MSTAELPALNATLNATSGVLLLLAYIAVKRGHTDLHRRLMFGALSVSSLFLISYLVYHASHGSTRFARDGALRSLYLGILLTHTVLAAAVVPLIITSVVKAVRGRFESHKRWARVTFPIWLYVSVTGVIIYMMLYRWFPGEGA